jgi:hypothetical protein
MDLPACLSIYIPNIPNIHSIHSHRRVPDSPRIKDATEALQLLLELLQTCVTTLPDTPQLWNAQLDMAGLGLIAKQATIGRQQQQQQEHCLLQSRTDRDICVLYCPFPLIGTFDTLAGALENATRHCNLAYDWDAKQAKMATHSTTFKSAKTPLVLAQSSITSQSPSQAQSQSQSQSSPNAANTRNTAHSTTENKWTTAIFASEELASDPNSRSGL